MPNFATAFKEEITRMARKEVRADTQKLKQASASHRSDIAALKRRIQELESQVHRLGKLLEKKAGASSAAKDAAAIDRPLRFRVDGLITQRQRLGLSAADMGALLGVSGQSVYKWESGKSRPRASQLEAIAKLRGIGKREATTRLAELAGQPPA